MSERPVLLSEPESLELVSAPDDYTLAVGMMVGVLQAVAHQKGLVDIDGFAAAAQEAIWRFRDATETPDDDEPETPA